MILESHLNAIAQIYSRINKKRSFFLLLFLMIKQTYRLSFPFNSCLNKKLLDESPQAIVHAYRIYSNLFCSPYGCGGSWKLVVIRLNLKISNKTILDLNWNQKKKLFELKSIGSWYCSQASLDIIVNQLSVLTNKDLCKFCISDFM